MKKEKRVQPQAISGCTRFLRIFDSIGSHIPAGEIVCQKSDDAHHGKHIQLGYRRSDHAGPVVRNIQNEKCCRDTQIRF